VWEFDGTNWKVVVAATTPIQCSDGAQLQYDPVRRRTVLVGCAGFPEADSASETWLWEGVDWTRAADSTQSPRGAAGGGLAFDAARGELVLVTHSTMATWAFDGTTWRQRAPATTPSPGVWVFDLAFDPASQRVVYFGGEHLTAEEPWNSTYPTSTWAWDGTDWHQLATSATPPPTIDYALAGFPERGGLVMHGGWGDPEWQFRASAWLLTLPGGPTPTIRFTEIRPLDGSFSLTSTGRVQAGASQILQAASALSVPAAWGDIQTNATPAGTNTWLVPRDLDAGFFRIVEPTPQ
jgi:hypothetical protein